MGYLQEIDALQRWVYGASRLPSYRLGAAPPTLPRPVIVWEPQGRQATRNISRWQYIKPVTQFGKLYAANLAQLLEYQDKLEKDLEERMGQLPVYDVEGPAGKVVAQLREVQLLFDHTGGGSSLDVQVRIQYEACYSRDRPADVEPAEVITKTVMLPAKPQ